MCSPPVREWDIVWVKQTLLQPWWPAVISSARDQPSKGLWQTMVGNRTMYHCTYLAMENKMDWVEEEHVKTWEEGKKIDHALDMKELMKRHHEAIELGLKIVTDPENLSEVKAEYYEQTGIKDELAMEAMKQDRDVNEALETIMIKSDEDEETKVLTNTPKKGVDPDKCCVLKCRSVRIGDYKVRPVEGVVVTNATIEMKIPVLDKSEEVGLTIPMSDVKKVLVNFKPMPLIFLDITPPAWQEIERILKMNSEQKYSTDNPERLITIVPNKVTEVMKAKLKKSFSNTDMHEIERKEANDILVKTHPKNG